MKTPEKKSNSIARSFAGLMSASIFLLSLTSCQQEDELTPSNASREILYGQHEEPAFYAEAAPENVSHGLDNYTLQTGPGGSIPVDTDDEIASTVIGGSPDQQIATAHPSIFNVIRIDHVSGRSRLPDYSVTVRSDGLVIYEGRNNVRVKERKTFQMSGVTLPVLFEIFEDARFYQIVPDFILLADMPYARTTFQPSQIRKAKSIVDNLESNPLQVIRIRMEVENLLGINRFVYGDFPADPDAAYSPASN